MTKRHVRGWLHGAGAGMLALAAAMPAPAEDKGGVFNATASMTTAAGASVTAPVIVSVTRWTTDAERDRAQAALRSGGSEAFHKAVSAMPEIGFVQVGAVKTPLRYARTLPVSTGTVVTAVTAAPIYHLGAGEVEAKPKAGYDMAVAIFEVDAAGKGTFGDFSPAAKVKIGANGSIVVEDYAVQTIQLSEISKK